MLKSFPFARKSRNALSLPKNKVLNISIIVSVLASLDYATNPVLNVTMYHCQYLGQNLGGNSPIGGQFLIHGGIFKQSWVKSQDGNKTI